MCECNDCRPKVPKPLTPIILPPAIVRVRSNTCYLCDADTTFYWCEACGKYTCRRCIRNAWGRTICKTCHDTAIECAKCGLNSVTIANHVMVGGLPWCPHCYSEYTAICINCATPVLTLEALRSDMGFTCRMCSTPKKKCIDCHTGILRGLRCENCSYTLGRENGLDYSLKRYTFNLRTTGSRAILDYHPRVFWHFKPGKDEASRATCTKLRYFGIELEMEHEDHVAQYINATYLGAALKDAAICCYDGSLSRNGIELITTPHTYEAFRAHNWKQILETLSKHGAKSHDADHSCGLHIHISRAHFKGREEEYQRLFTGLKYALTRFSKRKPTQITQYCQFGHNGRYSAVNLSNERTIEIRLWRGTLIYDRFMASIQITFALLDFMLAGKPNYWRKGIKLESELWNKFTTFVNNSPEYTLLSKYIKGKKYVRNSNQTKRSSYLNRVGALNVEVEF